MSTEKTIEPRLFGLLDDIGQALSNKPLDEQDEGIKKQKETLKMTEIETKLEDFIENFLLQFFRNGYGIEIDGVNDHSFGKVKSHFRLRFWYSPKQMLKIFKESIEVKEELGIAVYLSPPKDEVLTRTYRVFIRKMLKVFEEEGKEIANYNKLMIIINRTLELMNKEEVPNRQTKLL